MLLIQKGRSRRVSALPALLRLLVAAALVFSSACSQKPDQKKPPPPIEVGVISVDRGAIEQALEVSGSLKFSANTTISAEISAQVQSIEVADGQMVEQGQLLLVFDETRLRETANQMRATLQKDEATLAYNKTEWEKNLSLHESRSISQSQYEQKLSLYQNALAQVEVDKAALAKAMEDLNKTKVASPLSGVLSRRFIEKGDWVSTGGNLFQISDFRRIYVEAFISDMEVGKIDARKVLGGGVDARVTVDTYPGAGFQGRLTYIQPVANQERLFEIRIYTDNPDMTLLQGLFARARIVVARTPDVERVPIDALLEQVRNNSPNAVFVVSKEDKAKLSRIRIGAIDSANAQVIEGLSVGDVVVVRGKEVLNSGQPLKATEVPRPEKSVAATSMAPDSGKSLLASDSAARPDPRWLADRGGNSQTR
jgi:RND family efflux transporter MFP subunit